MKHLFLLFLSTGVLLLGLSGCAEKSVSYIDGEVPASHKISAPIAIAYSVPKKVSLGEDLLVTVTLTASADVENLTLTVSAGEGLTLPSGRYAVNFGSQQSGSRVTEEIFISPSHEGRLYLNLLVSGSFSGREMARAGAVPVQVGEGVSQMLKTTGAVAVDSDGKLLTISPAQE
ncbi:MAG: hypothetical protein L3J62_04155 [Gammaproteobacteria bacterium]|nr:hypothetical protein [Gammaproteobacteria bacterium]MCF6229976.1 hypothetical protein [Gammaproteobacteria bacterium]